MFNVNQEDIQKYLKNQEMHHRQDNFKIFEFEHISAYFALKRTFKQPALAGDSWQR